MLPLKFLLTITVLIFYLGHAASDAVPESDSMEFEDDYDFSQSPSRPRRKMNNSNEEVESSGTEVVEAKINQSVTLSCKSTVERIGTCYWTHGEYFISEPRDYFEDLDAHLITLNEGYRVTFGENGQSCDLSIDRVKDFDNDKWRCRLYSENTRPKSMYYNKVVSVRITRINETLDLNPGLPINPDSGKCQRKCRTKDQYGQQHEACLGSTSVTKCPAGSSGSISFECISLVGGGVEGRLNFSNCSSNWITDLMNFIGPGAINTTYGEHVLKNKIKSNLENSLYGHEIEQVLDIVDRVVNQTQINMQRVHESEKIVGTSIGIFGCLANETNNTWGQLDEIKRASVATRLFTTIENTAFILTNSSRNSSSLTTPGYMKTFNESNDLTVVVGALQRPGINQSLMTEADTFIDFLSDLQLPADWQDRVQGTGDIQFVQMKIATKLIDNMIPPSNGQHGSKSVNSQLNSFTVANSSGTVALNFTGSGIRITFQHTAKAWGSKESTIVPRRLHDGEQAKAVLGSGVCVYWDTQKLNWSTEGCEMVESNRTFTVCECQHLTGFAVLMSMHKYTGRDFGLTVTTISLCSLSMIALLATILIFQKFPIARNKGTYITVQLSGCLLFGNVLMLTIMDKNNFGLPDILCTFTGMLSHFVFLSAFTWMAIEGYVVYKMVTSVFVTGVENKIQLKLLGYGIPCFIVGGMIGFHFYAADPSYGGDLYCWLEGASIWTFIGPVLVVTTGNIFVLIIALIKAYEKNITSAKVQHSAGRATSNMIIGTLSLTCILGITWIFGLFLTESNSDLSAYLFTIFNASQGIFIFIFHCWMKKQVRQAISRKIAVWTSVFFPTDSLNSNLQKKTKIDKICQAEEIFQVKAHNSS